MAGLHAGVPPASMPVERSCSKTPGSEVSGDRDASAYCADSHITRKNAIIAVTKSA